MRRVGRAASQCFSRQGRSYRAAEAGGAMAGGTAPGGMVLAGRAAQCCWQAQPSGLVVQFAGFVPSSLR
jgi:hypothetical protein